MAIAKYTYDLIEDPDEKKSSKNGKTPQGIAARYAYEFEDDDDDDYPKPRSKKRKGIQGNALAPVIIKANPKSQQLEIAFVDEKGNLVDRWKGAHQAAINTILGGNPTNSALLEMDRVTQVESGIFETLRWHAESQKIFLNNPTQEVRNMIWFRMFTTLVNDKEHFRFRMHGNSVREKEAIFYVESLAS